MADFAGVSLRHVGIKESPAHVGKGMKVIGSDGVNIGRVKAARDNEFVLDRPKGTDLYVPLESVWKVENGSVVVLRIAADQIYHQPWERSA